MTGIEKKKLLFCYVDGMDLRRMDRTHAPFVFDALKSKTCVRVISPPSAESLATLLTSTYPSEHGMFGVRLKPHTSRSLFCKFIDQLPNVFTTTVQCIIQILTGSYDLPAIPPKRRRMFEILRTLQNRKYKETENLLQLGGVKSCLGVVGIKQSRYLYSRASNPVQELIGQIGTGDYVLEIVQIYSYDVFQRWNLDRIERVEEIYGYFDNFVRSIYEKCKKNNITLILFSDHGYDKIEGYIDLVHDLKELDLSEKEYTYFIELSMARFWFFSERARDKIVKVLRGIPNTKFFSWQELREFNISFNEPQYGEAFIMSYPGFVFFPHDFHQPIANLFLGITDPKQRPRLFNSRHRGDHTLLPYFESARGFMMLFDSGYEATGKEIDLIDVSPSLLDLLGLKAPESMKGNAVFKVG